MTAFEHRLSVNECDRPDWLAAKHNLFVFESRDTLNSVFIAAGSKRCFHARACVGVKLNSESRRETLRATGADETRVIESHHDHDAVAHDPFINGAQRNLPARDRDVRSDGPSRSALRNAIRMQSRRLCVDLQRENELKLPLAPGASSLPVCPEKMSST